MNNSEFLKTETKQLHDQTEKVMGADRIFGKDYQLDEYKGLLVRMYKPYSTIEKALRSFQEPKVQTLIDETYKEKAHFLERDLATLGVDSYSAADVFGINSIHEALGALYVLKGSDMGADIINKRLARVSGDWETKTFEFYSSEPNARESWKTFKEVLDNHDSDEVAQAELLSGATKAFLAFQ